MQHRGRAFAVFPWPQTNLELAFSSVGFSRGAEGGVDLLMNECELSWGLRCGEVNGGQGRLGQGRAS